MKTKWIKYRNTLFLLLVFPILAQSAIYQKTDAHGKPYFSDIPTTGSTLINLKTANIYSPVSFAKKQSSSDLTKQKNTDQKYYQKFLIIQPKDQQNFQNQQEISAAVQIDPELQSGDTIEWWLDEKRYQQNTNTQITINSLERGEHTLQAKLWDAKNHILLTTPIITFYVQLNATH